MISKQSKYINMVLKKMNFKHHTSKDMLKPKRPNHYAEVPKKLENTFHITKNVIHNCKCITLEKSKSSSKHLFYFHGGAYAMGPASSHWKLITYLLDHTDIKVSFINYPLYPESTCVHTVSTSLDIYEQLVDSSCEVILAGDSAGGGLALTIAQQLNLKTDTTKPNKLLLFSPWLDLSMEEDISTELCDNDLILTRDALKQAAINYAGDLSLKDSLCSPFYGNCKNLGNLALFTGTHDILNPQAFAFYNHLSSQHIAIDFYSYTKMQHVWVLLPIPEAKEALDKACDFINSMSS